MAAAVISVTRPSSVKGAWKVGNRQFHIRDLTADTGNYSAGGFTVTASQLGLRHIDFVLAGSIATNGTAGATANAVGITYAADGRSITVQVYESAATGLAQLEKTDAEAFAANWTVRLLAAGQ